MSRLTINYLLLPLAVLEILGCGLFTYKRNKNRVIAYEASIIEALEGETMFTSINTVAVYVSDMERAKDFYVDILGFKIKHDFGNLCFLISESEKIYIYLEAGYELNPVDYKSTHLSFFLKTTKSTKETFEALKAKGVTILDEEPEEVGDGVYVFRFLDPDGNILEATGN
ncbi:VOC family protein [candidate division WOR-3 bacterium]|nr:VOC family protein [candidate division WOR-3 bacterium]